jgi:hypothetical protein
MAPIREETIQPCQKAAPADMNESNIRAKKSGLSDSRKSPSPAGIRLVPVSGDSGPVFRCGKSFPKAETRGTPLRWEASFPDAQ